MSGLRIMPGYVLKFQFLSGRAEIEVKRCSKGGLAEDECKFSGVVGGSDKAISVNPTSISSSLA